MVSGSVGRSMDLALKSIDRSVGRSPGQTIARPDGRWVGRSVGSSFEFRTVGIQDFVIILCFCIALLVLGAHSLRADCLGQVDVGPFVPQRFQPPDYAWHHGARSYKQVAQEEWSRAQYGRSGEPVDATAELIASRTHPVDRETPQKSKEYWLEKRDRLGVGDKPQTADYIQGQVAQEDTTVSFPPLPQCYYPPSRQRSRSSQPHRHAWRSDGWSEQTAGGSWWSSSGWQGGRHSSSWHDANTATAWSLWPARASTGWASASAEEDRDHRGRVVRRRWGGGERHQ